VDLVEVDVLIVGGDHAVLPHGVGYFVP